MERLSRSEQTDVNERIRRWCGVWATLRWKNFRIQPRVRQDLICANAASVPARETNQIDSIFRFGDYVQTTFGAGANYINIPVMLFGLEGAGKSSVLGTWSCSSVLLRRQVAP